ncbi:hypothetical protein Hamer_G027256 [Homarus americanus]|uniref:Uncharacterized protein n=1 Tax=Homarus americanus TaxID=6706 RepID=A0A8J5IZT1_HOMAM|nr:hypothetical protein Hamer_G027256 [Homarus americanus]
MDSLTSLQARVERLTACFATKLITRARESDIKNGLLRALNLNRDVFNKKTWLLCAADAVNGLVLKDTILSKGPNTMSPDYSTPAPWESLPAVFNILQTGTKRLTSYNTGGYTHHGPPQPGITISSSCCCWVLCCCCCWGAVLLLLLGAVLLLLLHAFFLCYFGVISDAAVRGAISQQLLLVLGCCPVATGVGVLPCCYWCWGAALLLLVLGCCLVATGVGVLPCCYWCWGAALLLLGGGCCLVATGVGVLPCCYWCWNT